LRRIYAIINLIAKASAHYLFCLFSVPFSVSLIFFFLDLLGCIFCLMTYISKEGAFIDCIPKTSSTQLITFMLQIYFFFWRQNDMFKIFWILASLILQSRILKKIKKFDYYQIFKLIKSDFSSNFIIFLKWKYIFFFWVQ